MSPHMINGCSEFSLHNYYNVIDGQTRTTATTRRGINPATNEDLAPVPVSTKADLDDAILSARRAFRKWKNTPVEERKECVLALAQELLTHRKEFAAVLTAEQGKPLAFAEAEIDGAAGWLTGTVGLKIPEEIVKDTPEKLVKTTYVPLGIVVGIVPWNYPLMLLCGKLAPAVYTGNVIIIKPSPYTPYTGLKIVELAQKFFPRGVIQALSGDDSLGPLMTSRPDVDKISFTGSTTTGKLVMASAAKNLTRVTLELGGNDPAIICPDIDISSVAPKIALLAFMNAGQICVAIKRIYVHSSIYPAFRDEFVKATKAFKVGMGTEKGVFMGPVQNRAQFERVEGFLHDIHASKQTVALGGQLLKTDVGGLFIQPTVVDNPPDESKIVREEPFGPVVPLLQWADEDEVIARANNSAMGLGASVWSNDVEKAVRIGEQLESGSIWINEHIGLTPDGEFGGHKQSGIGSEWGVGGLRAMCNPRTMTINRGKS